MGWPHKKSLLGMGIGVLLYPFQWHISLHLLQGNELKIVVEQK